MAGGWDQGGGSPGQPQMSPQDIKRWQAVMDFLGKRGLFGMVNPAGGMGNQLMGSPQMQQAAQQMGQQGAMGGMDPRMMQMLQYYLQNQANNMGPQQGGNMQGPSYPQGGGGVGFNPDTLLGILGFPTR